MYLASRILQRHAGASANQRLWMWLLSRAGLCRNGVITMAVGLARTPLKPADK
ncbi:hypothetical protein KCP78_11535 [Salmonella enterica subsp. enterica]|nr:hypothetical protein KCP78_11535 [Salmonella enterica subsp. enterica]